MVNNRDGEILANLDIFLYGKNMSTVTRESVINNPYRFEQRPLEVSYRHHRVKLICLASGANSIRFVLAQSC
jgi:hypothetical protein